MSLKLEDVTYTYSPGTAYEMHALEHINLEIPNGQFVGIIGHTGSGKSTLVQHLNGLIRPTLGRVLYNGEDIWGEKYDRRALRSEVGLVFQYPEYQLFEETVYRDIAFGPTNMGLSKDEIDRRVRESAHFAGLTDDLLEKSPFALSGGQKRRVAIAGVIAMEPKVLLLDEPTAGLDPQGRDEILGQIERLNREHGLTILVVSHSMEDMARYVDRIMVMNDGVKMFDDTPKEVFRHYKELEAIGLAAPQITYVVQGLRERGIPIDDAITTVEEAREAILALYNKRREKQ